MYHFQKEIEEFEALIAKEVKSLHLIELCMKKCMNLNEKTPFSQYYAPWFSFNVKLFPFFLFDIGFVGLRTYMLVVLDA